MKQSIQIEWMKLFGQRKSKVLLIVTWISALTLSLGNLYFNSRAGFTMIDPDQMPLMMITLLGALLLPLVAYIMAVDANAIEYKSGTVKYGLMAPMSRTRYYLSKLASLSVYNAILLAGVLIITTITNLFGMTDNILLNIGVYFAAYVITLIPMTLVALWGMLIGTFFSSGLSLGLGIIGILALNVGRLFVPILDSISPLGYMNLYSQVIYGNASMAAMTSVLLYLISYYIILIALNVRRIQTKEI